MLRETGFKVCYAVSLASCIHTKPTMVMRDLQYRRVNPRNNVYVYIYIYMYIDR